MARVLSPVQYFGVGVVELLNLLEYHLKFPACWPTGFHPTASSSLSQCLMYYIRFLHIVQLVGASGETRKPCFW